MKQLILCSLLFIAPFLIHAQRDFDYTIYTTHNSQHTTQSDSSGTPLELSVLRKFQKEGNRLQVVSIVNTGDAVNYQLEYLGIAFESGSTCPELQYRIVTREGVITDDAFISINPMTPSVKIKAGEIITSFY